MSRYYILNEAREPVPCDLHSWCRWFEQAEARRVALWECAGVRVSTVFLGLDHRFYGDGPPLIFETMVFGGEHDGRQDRYATWPEAQAGHDRITALVRADMEEKGEASR